MKQWKKLAVLSAGALLTVGLAACGNDSHSSSASSSSKEKTSQVASSTKKNDTDATKTVYKVGQTINYKGLKLKVNSIKYSQGDGEANQPDNGKQYAIANVTLTNNKGKAMDYNVDDFGFDYNGDDANVDFVSGLDGVNEMESGSLDNGASITKDVVGQVPTQMETGKLQLTYKPDILDNNLKLRVQLN